MIKDLTLSCHHDTCGEFSGLGCRQTNLGQIAVAFSMVWRNIVYTIGCFTLLVFTSVAQDGNWNDLFRTLECMFPHIFGISFILQYSIKVLYYMIWHKFCNLTQPLVQWTATDWLYGPVQLQWHSGRHCQTSLQGPTWCLGESWNLNKKRSRWKASPILWQKHVLLCFQPENTDRSIDPLKIFYYRRLLTVRTQHPRHSWPF